MNIKERYIWILALVLVGFFFQNQEDRISDLNTLITTYGMEAQIQDQQINDFAFQLRSAEQIEYNKGFEDGRTQAGIALVQGGSLYDYADGYHAAVDQLSDESGLEVSRGILVELENLRKIVPRLLNQVEEITEENERLKSTSYEDLLLEMVSDGIDYQIETEESYLELLESFSKDENLSEKLTDLPVD